MDDDKFPKQQMGPVRLSFSYWFLWTKFEQAPYWSSQNELRNPRSNLGISLGGGKLFLQPTFVFPAPWNSRILDDFISQVEERLPFQFRNQYFKRSLPGKLSRRGRMLKLPKNWREKTGPKNVMQE
jgi:hypothetical protein